MNATLDYSGLSSGKPRPPGWAVLTAMVGCPLASLIAFTLGFHSSYGSISLNDLGVFCLIGGIPGAIGGQIVAAIGWAWPRHAGKMSIIGVLIFALAMGALGFIFGAIGSGLNGG